LDHRETLQGVVVIGYAIINITKNERKMMKRFILFGVAAILVAVLALSGILTYNTVTYTSLQPDIQAIVIPEINPDRAIASLQKAVQFKTLSYEKPELWDAEPFHQYHLMLEEQFPLVHERLQKEMVSNLSLLYTWQGSEPEKDALILLAHQDVVDAPDPDAWEHPPFDGVVADGFLWGRGTLDDKGSMIGILNAVEILLERGFQPKRTLYLCFGHDEEVGGWNGAAKIAETLRERGIKAMMSLDEGMLVVDGDMLGLDKQIAFVSITEKGYLSLELTAHGEPGHSSTPPKETTLGILSRAVTQLESNPMPAVMPEPVQLMFRYVGPEMTFPMNTVFANLWLTEPLIMKKLARERTTDAVIRTTTAITIMEGGIKDNVLPATARAVVNFRLLPGVTIEQVIERVHETINDDRIEINITGHPNESPPMARVDVPAYGELHTAIRLAFSDVIVAPSMMLGGSDTHHYAGVASNRYGFLPVALSEADLERIHGPDERIGVDAFQRMIWFYMTFIENAAGR